MLTDAIAKRAPLFDAKHETAVRLFNGFTEGDPTLVLEVFARCLLIHDYSTGGDAAKQELALKTVREALPWIDSAVLKVRDGADRNGRVLFGEPPNKIRENGVLYALDLTLNRDASFYLDTRNLRAWAKQHLAGKRVLNTFAYTGSLGVAARVAPASRVISTDASRQFLAVAQRSFDLNGVAVAGKDLKIGDFFEVVAQLKKDKALFDCVFVDPPIFAKTDKGLVDLQEGMGPVINKARPLVGHDGFLVVVNNGVFISGKDFKALLDALCTDGYMRIEELIPVPDDCRGYTIVGTPPADPAPFNHSTKIAVLRVSRKDGRS